MNILKMDSSDEEVLLESSYFDLNYHQDQIKKKKKKNGKGRGYGKNF